MFDRIKDDLINFITSRITLLTLVFIVLGGILIYRCFDLQIVHGQEYLDEFILETEKTRDIPSSRGTIYDRNGVALAYDELAYSVKIEDVYESVSGKNKKLNATIYKLIKFIEKNGDSIIADFNIILDENNEFAFTLEEGSTRLYRFLADVYGYTTIDKMKEKEPELLYSTARDVIDYLGGTKKFAVGDYETPGDSGTDFVVGKGYTNHELLQMITIRYSMWLTSYRKYIGTEVATDISEETVAVIMENITELEGVTIEADTVRRYTEDSQYFAHILGYTGKISSDELDTLNQQDLEEGGTGDRYSINDMVGKSGIEQYMETTLQGTKGYEKVSVDNTGRVTSILDRMEAQAGEDVYLTIDSKLQSVAYQLLEQHIAGIVVNKIIPAKSFELTGNQDNSDIKIPIYYVYIAILNNSVVDIRAFDDEDAGDTEKEVHAKYLEYKEQVYERLYNEFYEKKTIYDDLTLEYQNYQTDIVALLKKNGVLDTSLIDYNDQTQIAWATDEVISIHEYLKYCISMNWINVSKLDLTGQYSDTEEIYTKLCDYIIEAVDNNLDFQKQIYRFMIKNDVISGREVCQIICEQDAAQVPEEEEEALFAKKLSAYDFMLNRLKDLDITPAQLALDPCNGSFVMTDVNTGEVLALVTYPGYDNNKMANTIDSEYWNKLLTDKSRPLINFASYYSAAPGSTFKVVSATAALMEGMVNLDTKINCVGKFSLVTPSPYCWRIYGHGNLDVTGAIANSCNYFFYNVGYNLAMVNGSYNAEDGLSTLRKYAEMYGLGEKTGIEIVEETPKISDELPIPSAIGQGTNSFTAVGLARYVAAIANKGTSYNLTLLDSVKDSAGNILVDYEPEVYNDLVLPQEYWSAIHEGMRTVVKNKVYFNQLTVNVAGKTGTAEENENRPNHALFVGFAPYESPEIAITTRIPFGYSSDYAAQISRNIIGYYYGVYEAEDLITGKATSPDAGVSNNEI